MLEGDCDRTIGLVRDAGQAGDRVMLLALGNLYESGSCVDQDLGEAFRIYRKLALAGMLRARILLGHAYLKGLGVPKDALQAQKWFRSAAYSLAPYSSSVAENVFSSEFIFRGTPQGALESIFKRNSDNDVLKDTEDFLDSLHNGLRNTPPEFLRELQKVRVLFNSGPITRREVAGKLKEGDGVPRNVEEGPLPSRLCRIVDSPKFGQTKPVPPRPNGGRRHPVNFPWGWLKDYSIITRFVKGKVYNYQKIG